MLDPTLLALISLPGGVDDVLLVAVLGPDGAQAASDALSTAGIARRTNGRFAISSHLTSLAVSHAMASGRFHTVALPAAIHLAGLAQVGDQGAAASLAALSRLCQARHPRREGGTGNRDDRSWPHFDTTDDRDTPPRRDAHRDHVAVIAWHAGLAVPGGILLLDAIESFHDDTALRAVGFTDLNLARTWLRWQVSMRLRDPGVAELIERRYLTPHGSHEAVMRAMYLSRSTYFRWLGEARAALSVSEEDSLVPDTRTT
jgi:hypothetical protein